MTSPSRGEQRIRDLALSGTVTKDRIRELESLVLELEGEVRALSGDCLLAYRERDRARSLACRLQAEYEQVAGAWGSGALARDCADHELATYGITLSSGPGDRHTRGTPILAAAPRAPGAILL